MILLRDDGTGHEVVQMDLQGFGEVGLVLQVTRSGGDCRPLAIPLRVNVYLFLF